MHGSGSAMDCGLTLSSCAHTTTTTSALRSWWATSAVWAASAEGQHTRGREQMRTVELSEARVSMQQYES